jgi:hypothetical protein
LFVFFSRMARVCPALAQAIMHSLCASPLAPFITQQDGSITSPAIVLTPSLPDAGAPFVEEDADALALVAVVVFVVVPAVFS